MQELELLATQQVAPAGGTATGQLALIAQLQRQLAARDAELDAFRGRPAPGPGGEAAQEPEAAPGEEPAVHGAKRSACDAEGSVPAPSNCSPCTVLWGPCDVVCLSTQELVLSGTNRFCTCVLVACTGRPVCLSLGQVATRPASI